MSSKYYEDQLLNAIDTMVDSAVSRADYDKTIRAVVNKCIDQTTGRYEIKYQESIFEAVTNNTDIKYKDGTQVYILVPGNDMRQTKIILHAVDAEGMQDLAIKEISVNSYETIGQNTIEENSFSLKSYLGDDNFTVYDREEGINYIYYDENALQAHIQEAEGLLMGATFKTELTEEQKRGSGNFGVKFEVDFNGTGVDELITREFVIDINHGMMGDPYNFIDEIEQKQNFFMDLTDYNSLRKVTIFAENFPNIDVLKEPDIFFSNFKLQTTRHITEGYSLRIKTDKEYFGKDDNINSKINVTSELCLNGYPLERNSEYYWFKQNNKIDGSDPNWNKYAGAGWKCLNASQDTGSGTKVWDTDEKQLVIKYSDCPALENNYKLIIVLKNNEQTVVEQNFSIRNYNTDFSFEIESDEGTEFSFNNGSPTLTAKFESSEEYNPTKLEYVWTVEDNLGQVKQLPQTIEDNENYNQARDNYYSLLSEIESGEKFANENISKLNEYLTEMKKYDTMQRVERNQIIHVNIQEIDEYSYYCCSIYFEDGLLGSAKIKLTRIMELQGDYTLSIINGNQTFNYSVDGLAPTHSSLEKPIKLEPLAIELIDNKGKKFSDYMLDYCNIKWIAPTNSLIKAQDSSDKTFTYELEDLYNINKIDNSVIKLEVEYQGIVFNAQTNFSFVKDGEPGTNGTGVVCKIVPNTNDNMEFYPTIYYSTFNNEKPYLNFTPINGDKKQAGKWFKVQLWQNGEKIFDGTDSGSGVQITWSILVNRYNASTSDPSAFKIENNIFNFTQYEPNGANILKATIKYNNSIYTCTLPILTMRIDNSDYRINLIKNTGFRYVMYSSDGKSPKYDNATPFKLLVTKWINDKWEDISDNRYPGYQISYHWYIKGRLYNGTSWYDQYNLAGRTNEIGNEGYYVPVESYNGCNVTNALGIDIKVGNTSVVGLHIPIDFYLDRYGISAINGWDGNTIQINKDEGMIIAPQVGVGRKEADNSFTGIVIGEVKERANSESENGLFGYTKGSRSIFLDAETGKAEFGLKKQGQIIIDPQSESAQIKGGNYVESSSNGEGMLIDLKNAYIKWGNGKFRVTADGQLYSTAGRIANWTIEPYKLIVTGDTGKVAAIQAPTKDTYWVFAAGGSTHNSYSDCPFRVGKNGDLFATNAEIKGKITATSGKIADYTISGAQLIGNNVGMSGTSGQGWAFWAGSNTSGSAPFRVGHNGSLFSTSGQIGGLTIESDKLYIGDCGMSSAQDHYAFWSGENNGAHGTGSSNAKFKVGHDGILQAEQAVINGSINGSSISGGTISGAYLSGGMINVATNAGGYLRAGTDTNHPTVSGLNVGSYGIQMDGNSIGGCNNLGVNIISSASSESGGSVSCNTTFKVPSPDSFIVNGDSRTLRNFTSDMCHSISNVSRTVWIECGEGLGWKEFIIQDGYIMAIN